MEVQVGGQTCKQADIEGRKRDAVGWVRTNKPRMDPKTIASELHTRVRNMVLVKANGDWVVGIELIPLVSVFASYIVAEHGAAVCGLKKLKGKKTSRYLEP